MKLSTEALREDFSAEHADGTACPMQGYRQCRLPHSITDDTQLDLAALFLLSYRVRQSPDWGTDRHKLARDFGFGEISFYGAVKMLADAGYMKRGTTKRKNLVWFAREKLDFSDAPKGRDGYQQLSRTMGELHWKQHALLVYLNSWPRSFVVTPERIAHRFNLHIKTVRRLMAPLVKYGLAMKRDKIKTYP